MKVAAIANAIEQYNYAKNKVTDSEMALMECRLLDVLNGNEERQLQCQEMRVHRDKKQLAELLNMEIENVPLIHPQFGVNNTAKKGLILDREG